MASLNIIESGIKGINLDYINLPNGVLKIFLKSSKLCQELRTLTGSRRKIEREIFKTASNFQHPAWQGF